MHVSQTLETLEKQPRNINKAELTAKTSTRITTPSAVPGKHKIERHKESWICQFSTGRVSEICGTLCTRAQTQNTALTGIERTCKQRNNSQRRLTVSSHTKW